MVKINFKIKLIKYNMYNRRDFFQIIFSFISLFILNRKMFGDKIISKN